MVGMFAIHWVVMGHGVGKRLFTAAAAVVPLVNVEPEYSCLAGLAGLRKPAHFSIDDYTLIGLVKAHPA